MKSFSAVLAILFFLTSCSTYTNTSSGTELKNPVISDQLIYSYSSDLVRDKDNNLRKGWANRNNVQVLNLELINTTDHPIHGSQLAFFSDGKKLELANNHLASKKLKTKKFPTIVYLIPVVLVAVVVYAAIAPSDDLDGDGFSDVDTGSKKEKKDPMEHANLIQKALYDFNIASEILYPNEKLSGLVALHSDETITDLEIRVKEADFEVTSFH